LTYARKGRFFYEKCRILFDLIDKARTADNPPARDEQRRVPPHESTGSSQQESLCGIPRETLTQKKGIPAQGKSAYTANPTSEKSTEMGDMIKEGSTI